MTIVLTLIPQFKRLPMELVHQICIFTGKFIFDINGCLKSIINIDDFKNIQTLLLIHDYHQNKYLFHRFNNDQKIRFIQNLYSDRKLKPEERVKEEVLSVQNLDFKKQPYLFTKPLTMEQVMIPDKVDLKTLCDGCCAEKLLTKNPEKKRETSLPIRESPQVFNYVNGIFGNFGNFGNFGMYYHFDNTHIFTKKCITTKKKVYCDTCSSCNNPLFPIKLKSLQENIHKKTVKFDRLVKKPKAIKNFRCLN
jgi:hypothetical protein